MTQPFEDRVRDRLDERGTPDEVAMSTVTTRIDSSLPVRRRRPAWSVAARRGSPRGPRGRRRPGVPPDRPSARPARSARPGGICRGSRLAHCFGPSGTVEFAFVMPHARDYQRHFPAMLCRPELDVDDPAFVVVFAAGGDPIIPLFPALGASPVAAIGGRAMCVLVGDTPNLYAGVDIAGMQVDLGTSATSTSPVSPSRAKRRGSVVLPGAEPFLDDPRFRAMHRCVRRRSRRSRSTAPARSASTCRR